MERILENNRADWAGIFSSGLCLIHCLLTPVLVLFQVHSVGHEAWAWMDWLFLLVSGLAIVFAFRHPSPRWVKGILLAGFALLALALVFHEEPGMIYLSYLAAASLIGGHYLNIRTCRH